HSRGGFSLAMEWLILLVLVPAILVPVVLLFGFSGCRFSPRGAPGGSNPPPVIMPPTDVKAVPKNIDHITLSCQQSYSNTTKYKVVRNNVPMPDVPDAPNPTVDDTGLDASTLYTYQVSTITADGTSDPTMDMASTFQPTFQADPAAISQPGFAGDFCYVQRI